MRAETLILGLMAVAMSIIAFSLWRAKVRFQLQLRAAAERCRRSESENLQLRQSLIARENAESDRISRLEHDLKSPLGAILGFSALLREFSEGQPGALPPLSLRYVSAIDQACRKMLQIIEAAAQDAEADSDRERIVLERKTS